MANSIAFVKNCTAVLDEVYRRATCSTCFNTPGRMTRDGCNAKEIMVPVSALPNNAWDGVAR